MRRTGWIVGVLACVAGSSFAIVPNTGIDNDFTVVGRTQFGGGSLVAVGRRVVMTARHVDLTANITFGADGTGTLYSVDLSSKMDVGNSDIRLYRTNVDLPNWAEIDFNPLTTQVTHDVNFAFTATGQNAEALTAVGYGVSGALNGAGTGYNADFNTPMHRRKGNFFSDSRGPAELDLGGGNVIGPFSTILSFLIANGDGTLAPGDSGGGLFKEINGVQKLVGINSFTLGTNRNFLVGSSLSFASGFAELAPHKSEIEAYLVPEPASMAAMALGIAALARRRRKS